MSKPEPDPGDLYPSLTYSDAPAAISWLCRCFGFEERLVVPGPDGQVRHSELSLGRAVIMVSSPRSEQQRVAPQRLGVSFALSLFVDDPDAHFERAQREGVEITQDLKDEDFGARGYMARDPEGHQWCFSNYRPGRWWGGAEEDQ